MPTSLNNCTLDRKYTFLKVYYVVMDIPHAAKFSSLCSLCRDTRDSLYLSQDLTSGANSDTFVPD